MAGVKGIDILAVDAASRSGWTFGAAGCKPNQLQHGAVRLRTSDKHLLLTAHLAHRWLDRLWTERPDLIPDLMVIEEPSLRTERTQLIRETGKRVQVNTGAHTPVMLSGLAMGLVSGCEFQVPPVRWEVVGPKTWQKAILGPGKRPGGKDLKIAVRRQLQLAGYYPKNRADDDESDSAGIWVWAQGEFGRRAPPELFLTGERLT